MPVSAVSAPVVAVQPRASLAVASPMTALVAILNPWVARLMARYGHVAMIATGQLIMVAGLAGLSLLPADAPVLLVAALMVPVGVGGSFTVPP
jgi:MFS transporter, DHA2 family, methylenomycin A resistance protein